MFYKLFNAFIIFQFYVNKILKLYIEVFYVIYFDNILIYLKIKKNILKVHLQNITSFIEI